MTINPAVELGRKAWCNCTESHSRTRGRVDRRKHRKECSWKRDDRHSPSQGPHAYVREVLDLVPLLRAQPVLAGLNLRQLEFLASVCREVSFSAGQVIFNEDDDADVFYILVEGEVTVELRKRRTVPFTIQTFREGDVVGLSWVYPPHRWVFTAVAERGCIAFEFDAEAVRKECEVNHELGYRLYGRLLEVAGKRLQATRLALMELSVRY